MKVTVIIPTYKPDGRFRKLLEGLKEQTCPIERLIIMNTEEKYWKEEWIAEIECAEVHHIRREDFDHGKTRRDAAAMVNTEFFCCFTQDAVLTDRYVVEKLVQAFENPKVAAAYGRQLPAEDCSVIEAYTRAFNYPAESIVKTKADLNRLGIKTFFCSNVCAAYRKTAYDQVGGFLSSAIFNEDMILAGTLIQAGYAIAYQAEAKVIHSHNYGNLQQFKRNFDLAVSQADHPEIFAAVPSEGEGIRLVKKTAGYLIKVGKPWLLPSLVIGSGFKFFGYRTGKAYRKLPMALVKKCTSNPSYWEKRE